MLARAKGTSVQGLVEAGILKASRGKVRLLKRDELDAGWDPATDTRRTVWEVTQHLIRALESGGEGAAQRKLVARVARRPTRRETSRIGSTASASERSGRRRPSGTTPW